MTNENNEKVPVVEDAPVAEENKEVELNPEDLVEITEKGEEVLAEDEEVLPEVSKEDIKLVLEKNAENMEDLAQKVRDDDLSDEEKLELFNALQEPIGELLDDMAEMNSHTALTLF